MKFVLFALLSLTLACVPSYGIFKDPQEETIVLRYGENTFPVKLRGLQFQKKNNRTIAYREGRLIGIVADARSLEIVNKYIENPDYHLDTAKKLGFYIGGPLLVLGFYVWRRRKEAKQKP